MLEDVARLFDRWLATTLTLAALAVVAVILFAYRFANGRWPW